MKRNTAAPVRTIFAIAFMVLSSSVFTTASAAAEKNKAVKQIENKPQLELKYVGQKDNGVFIKISLNGQGDEKSFLQIFDFYGEKLHEELVSSKDFSRTIMVFPDEINRIKIVYSSKGVEVVKAIEISASETRFALTALDK